MLFTWLYAVACALQIYFDFSGYSAIWPWASAGSFGFHFPENFRYPFLSGSVTEFWRRWHISLGSWFRDYVYIPLGGQPLLPQPVAAERVPCLGPDGPVARGGVEFRAVGACFSPSCWRRKKLWYGHGLEKTRLLKHLYMLPCWR